jgi:hypothetical protein
MAKDILYIDNGTNINVGWVNHIVISYDGVNWDGIDKTGVSAGVHPLNLNTTTVTNSYPERNKEDGYVVVVRRSNSEGPLLKFNPENVLNQAAWSTSGSAASKQAGAQAALADILAWLGQTS